MVGVEGAITACVVEVVPSSHWLKTYSCVPVTYCVGATINEQEDPGVQISVTGVV
jgi:hypothetical protein